MVHFMAKIWIHIYFIVSKELAKGPFMPYHEVQLMIFLNFIGCGNRHRSGSRCMKALQSIFDSEYPYFIFPTYQKKQCHRVHFLKVGSDFFFLAQILAQD